jgi:TIR domain
MNILKLQRRPTANLTFEQQVVREHFGLESVPGYVLVIFEKLDNGGATFSRLVASGERFHSRIPFRDLSKKYFAIAVNDSVLSYAFDNSITLNSGIEAFILNFHLTYRVTDHRKVAEICEHDPLKQLRDEIARVIGRNCAKRKTEMFKDRFRDLERIVIDAESARLRSYAAELGFKIISIDLDKPLPDYNREVADARQRSEAEKDRFAIEQGVNRVKRETPRAVAHRIDLKEVDHKYDIAQLELERRVDPSSKLDEVHRAKQRRKLHEIQTDGIGQALTNVSEGINAPLELRDAFEVAREINDPGKTNGGYISISNEQPPYQSERAGGDAQNKIIGDSEKMPLDESFVNDQSAQNLLVKTWKNETTALINMLDDAGDSDTSMLLRETLYAIGARLFPLGNSSGQSVSMLTDDSRVLDSITCSVFAPPEAYPGTNLMVQAFAHVAGDSEIVSELAREFDHQANRLTAKLLDNQVGRATELTFSLSIPGLHIDDPVQKLIWRGRPEAIQFGVLVPEHFSKQEIVGTVYVSQDAVPFGHARFLLRIVDLQDGLTQEITEPAKVSAWRRYEYAFISYASADRPEVLKRVQMLSRFHIDFFQDLLTLEPGEQWEQTIYQSIDRSDVFFLFWSSAARSSEWVMKEIRYALERKGTDRWAAPEIVPVIIEGPPPVPPPAELKDIHFNDQFIYFINAG